QLKGSSSNIGAKSIEIAAEKLEKLCRQYERRGTAVLIEQIENFIERIQNFLN
ncbi:Hpt domain-containing protein, partial [Aetokthonos hydrillicola]|uniref:Hpt domain-containing protein n=1 Tax=Aetokthonos hydrillicola TaxID=1550245 RepID=UPI001ABB42F7